MSTDEVWKLPTIVNRYLSYRAAIPMALEQIGEVARAHEFWRSYIALEPSGTHPRCTSACSRCPRCRRCWYGPPTTPSRRACARPWQARIMQAPRREDALAVPRDAALADAQVDIEAVRSMLPGGERARQKEVRAESRLQKQSLAQMNLPPSALDVLRRDAK